MGRHDPRPGGDFHRAPAGREASGLAISGANIGALFTVLGIVLLVLLVSAAHTTSDQWTAYWNCLDQQRSNPSLVCTPPG